MKQINWNSNPWDLTSEESFSSAPPSSERPSTGAPRPPLSDRARQIIAKPLAERTDSEQNFLKRELYGNDTSIGTSRLQESRIAASSNPKTQGKPQFSGAELDATVSLISQAQQITAEMLKGIREGNFQLTETALQQVAASTQASLQLTQAVLTQQQPQFVPVQRANFAPPYPRQRNWLRRGGNIESSEPKNEVGAKVYHSLTGEFIKYDGNSQNNGKIIVYDPNVYPPGGKIIGSENEVQDMTEPAKQLFNQTRKMMLTDPRKKEIDLYPYFMRTFYQNAYFYQLVTDKAVLDIKLRPESPFYIKKHMTGYAFYQGRLLRIDYFGNINYGVAGKAFGFSKTWSHMGAGINQLKKLWNDSNYPVGSIDTYFDEIQDYNAIKEGYNMF